MRRNPQRLPLTPEVHRTFTHAVVIPACAEREFLPRTLESLVACELANGLDVAVIVVVNNHSGASAEVRADNQDTLKYLSGCGLQLNLFYIDAASPGCEISLKGGVGEARKLGMDCALRLLEPVESALMFCLDADTVVEGNYFNAALAFFCAEPESPAGVLSFHHQAGSSPAHEAAVRQYEHYMDSYVAGLKYAGSPYAYHAIGSAIVCRAGAYVSCGGMKVRNGGEDFYFLQSLRKLGVIGEISASTVHPSARDSDRVSFGTGPRIKRIIGGDPIKFYDPAVFVELKRILELVETLPEGGFIRLPELFDELSGHAAAFMREHGFAEAWSRIYRNTPTRPGFMARAFHTWFDAFRTLKFIHFCEDKR